MLPLAKELARPRRVLISAKNLSPGPFFLMKMPLERNLQHRFNHASLPNRQTDNRRGAIRKILVRRK